MSFVTRTIAAVLLAGCATPAFAVDINFSFQDGTTSYFYGREHVAGTVTGTLYGLTDNATSLPTSFRISTSPNALNLIEATFSTANYFGSPGITLVNGVVTAANLFANFNDSADHAFQLRLNCTYATTCGAPGQALNHLINNGFGNGGTGNQAGFGGATYSAAAVPEPAAWAMMLGGFGLMGFALRRQSKVRTAVRFT